MAQQDLSDLFKQWRNGAESPDTTGNADQPASMSDQFKQWRGDNPPPAPPVDRPVPPVPQEPSLVGGFLSEVKSKILHPIDAVSDAAQSLVSAPGLIDPTNQVVDPRSDPEQMNAIAQRGYELGNVGPYTPKGAQPLGPVAGTIAKNISGLTSPATLATIGGVAAATALPVVGPAIGIGAALGFGAQQMGGAVEAVKAAQQAAQTRDDLLRIAQKQHNLETTGQLNPDMHSDITKLFQYMKQNGLVLSPPPQVVNGELKAQPSQTSQALTVAAQHADQQVKALATQAVINGGMALLTSLGLAKEVMPEALPPSHVGMGEEGPLPAGAAADAAKMVAEQELRAEPARKAWEAAHPQDGTQEAQAAYDARMREPMRAPNARGGTSMQTPPYASPRWSPENIAYERQMYENGWTKNPSPFEDPNYQSPPEGTEGEGSAGPTRTTPFEQATADPAQAQNAQPENTQEPTQAPPETTAPTEQPTEPDPNELHNKLALKYDVRPSDAKKMVSDVLEAHGVSPAMGPTVTPQPNQDLTNVANEYNASVGLPPIVHRPFTVDENHSRAVATAYDQAKSDPNSPEVQSAYTAFNAETHKQFDLLKSKGYTFEPTDNPTPYRNSKELHNDVNNNRHLFVTTAGAPHPLMTPEQTFEFRAVHDVIGHVAPGAEFGHGGEIAAFNHHAQMYSPEAQKVLPTETIGQNAAVHFSPKLNNPASHLYTDNLDREFNYPEQKATILPEHLRSMPDAFAQWRNQGLQRSANGGLPQGDGQHYGQHIRVTEVSGVPIILASPDAMSSVGFGPYTSGQTVLNPAREAARLKYVALTPHKDNLGMALSDISKKYNNAPVVLMRSGMSPEETATTLAHELVHAKTIHRFSDAAYNHPMISKGANNLRRSNPAYSNYSNSWAGNEFVAHTMSGEWHALGLNLNQAIEGLFHAITTMADEGDVETAFSLFEHAHPALKETVNEIRARYPHVQPTAEPVATTRSITQPEAEPEPSGVQDGGTRNSKVERPGSSQGIHPNDAVAGPERAGQGRSKNPQSYLTEDERGQASDPKVLANVKELFDKLPSDFATAAKLGAAGRYWYENSAKALKNYFGDDAPQFTNLLAAYSPRQTVRENLQAALDAWHDWSAQGRPSDEPTISSILDNHAGGEVFGARFQNAVRSLQGVENPLSGQKVNSFFQNLIGNVDFVTNDVWMSKFAGIAHSVLGTKYGYLALTAKVRQAAQELGWSPQQVQSGVWVFTKALWELGVKGLPPKEVVTRLNLNDAKDLTDFATIFAKDPDVREKLASILEQQGSSLDAVESKLKKKDLPVRGAKEAVSPQAARKVAERLTPDIETARKARLDAAAEVRRQKAEEQGQGSLFRNINPLPDSKEYTAIYNKQNGIDGKGLKDKLTEFVDNVKVKQLNATRKIFDKWIDVRHLMEDAEKAGISTSPIKNPYIGLQIGYGGGNGGFAATMLDTLDILKDAKKQGVYSETTAYFNLAANQRALDVVREKEAEARANGDTKTADEYFHKLATSKVAAGGFNDNTIARDKKALKASMTPDKWKQVEALADREFKLNRDALDFLYQRGRISKEAYDKMVARGPEYITMTRIMDTMENINHPGGKSMSVRKLGSVQALEGSELANQNPWIADPIRRGMAYREEARMAPVEQLHDLALQHPFFKSFVREMGPAEHVKKGEGEINYIKKGITVRLAVPDVLADAMKITSEADSQILGQALLQNVAGLVRPSLTGMNLAYAATSPLREAQDALTYLARSPKDFARYAEQFAKSVVHIIKKDQTYREALRAGVAYTSIQSRLDPLSVLRSQEVRNLINPGHSISNGLMSVPDTIAGINEAMQIAGKMAARQMAINKGVNPIQATADARTYAGRPDVANAGTMASQINPLLLFLVDKLKGAERSWLFFKKFPKYAAAATMAYLMAELAINRYNAQFTSPEYEAQREAFLSSDEGKDPAKAKQWEEDHKDEVMEWQHVSDKDRSNYTILLTPHVIESDDGTLHRFGIKIATPRSFFGNAARSLWEGVFGQVKPEQAMLNEISSALPGDYTLRKGDVGGGLFRGTASALNPALQEPMEQLANTDTYTGNPIESEGMQNRVPEYRYKENTSPLSIKIGEALKSSPLRIEHALRNFGGLGEMVTGLIDKALSSEDNRVPPGDVESITRLPIIGPVARRFLLSGVDQTRTDREREFYDALATASQATDTIRGMKGAKWGAVLDRFSDDPSTVSLAYIHPDLDKVSRNLHAMRVAMAEIGTAKTKGDLGDTVEEWNGNPEPVTDIDKRAAVRAVHGEYMKLLDTGLSTVRQSNDAWKDTKRTGNEDELEQMFNSIITR